MIEYDLETNDFVRDPFGNLDSSFDEFYIPCKKKCEIRHCGGNILKAFITSVKNGNIIKNKIDLISPDIIFDFEQDDFETFFKFKAKYIDVVAEIMGAKTSGANISPFAVSNLPKSKFKLPEEELERYKGIIKDINKDNMLLIKTIYNDFNDVIYKKMGKNYNINQEKKKLMLKNKEFIYKIGLWEDFLIFLEKEIKKRLKTAGDV